MNDRERARQVMMPVFTELDKYDIAVDKTQSVIAFTVDYYSRNKQMKRSRLIRKIVDEFHLKLKQ